MNFINYGLFIQSVSIMNPTVTSRLTNLIKNILEDSELRLKCDF